MNSQTLVIGNPDTNTDNDFTGHSGSSVHSSRSGEVADEGTDAVTGEGTNDSRHMNYSEALETLQEQQIRFSQMSQTMIQQSPSHNSEIDWNNYMNPEDDEFPIDRHLRLAREEEEEERARLSGRLTAPADEIRRRTKKAPSNNQDDVVAQLRIKQIQLADEQLKVQKVLLETATIAQDEAKERLKMVAAQRKRAEIELRLKEIEFSALTD